MFFTCINLKPDHVRKKKKQLKFLTKKTLGNIASLCPMNFKKDM